MLRAGARPTKGCKCIHRPTWTEARRVFQNGRMHVLAGSSGLAKNLVVLQVVPLLYDIQQHH